MSGLLSAFSDHLAHLIFSDSVPVQQSELQLDVRHSVVRPGEVEHKGLVENWVQGSLLYVSFLL